MIETYILIMVIAFGLHNWEEARQMENWANAHLPTKIARLYRTRNFVRATTFLWVLYALMALGSLLANWAILNTLFALTTATIFANGLTHIIGRLTKRLADFPGIWSAAFLITPLGILMINWAIQTGVATPWQIAILVALGALIQIPLAYFAVWMFDRLGQNSATKH